MDAQEYSRQQGEKVNRFWADYHENRERIYKDLASRTEPDELLLAPPPRLSPPRPVVPAEPAPRRGRALRDMDVDNRWAPECTPAARAARISGPAALASFGGATFAAAPDRDAAGQVEAWARDAAAQPGLILFGPYGGGKTALAYCTTRLLAEAGVGSRHQWNLACMVGAFDENALSDYDDGLEADGRPSLTPWPTPCWFQSWAPLARAYRQELARSEAVPWITKLKAGVTALALDDVGTLDATDFREDGLREIIDEWLPARGRRLVLTTNASPDEWPAKFGGSVASRLLGGGFLKVAMLGDDLRSSL